MVLLRMILWGMLLCGATTGVFAQEGDDFEQLDEDLAAEGAGGGGGGAGGLWKLGILEVMSPRFNDPHPFEQMTGTGAFNDALSSAGSSFEYSASFEGDPDGEGLQQLLRLLPPISIDYATSYDAFLLKGLSYGYYHTISFEEDAIVGGSADGRRSDTPILEMKAYYDLFYLLWHPFFDPKDPGPNVYFGFGFASISGAYLGGFRGRIENNFTRSTDIRTFEAFPVSFRMAGVDVDGETLGFRFNLIALNNDPVLEKEENLFIDNPSGLTPDAGESITFSGILMRLAMTVRL